MTHTYTHTLHTTYTEYNACMHHTVHTRVHHTIACTIQGSLKGHLIQCTHSRHTNYIRTHAHTLGTHSPHTQLPQRVRTPSPCGVHYCYIEVFTTWTKRSANIRTCVRTHREDGRVTDDQVKALKDITRLVYNTSPRDGIINCLV